MCGRYAVTLPPEAMVGLFNIDPASGLLNLEPRWNLAPSQGAPVVAQAPDGARQMKMVRWGLHPSWLKEPPGAKSMINARSETAFEKPFFREAWKKRRCLVPADGFYEWRREGTAKTPFWITRSDGAPMVFAGLWDRWRRPDAAPDDPDAWVRSFAILTTGANLATPHETLQGMMQPLPDEAVSFRAVSPAVNSARAEGPALLEAV
jgi:putative SOS response-associated peptidase YedK